ncbi:IS607 family transposase [Brasilonema sp. UFV-L1]|nr:IS607 family transposase [Brasilonema sp. UFV-L1]NMG11955.1 IS607 family transposase [Brasilonema sp. UFV-L1]
MKLSEYAKKLGVSYHTVWRLWKQGQLDAYQLPTGTVIVRDGEQNPQLVHEIACIYARVSSSENKDNLKRQADRLVQYSTARGYGIYKVVEEVGSGLNDNRQKLISVLSDKKFNVLVVEHKDRLTRFGANYIQVLLTQTGRRLEVVNNAANDKEDLMSDFAAVITSFCSRLYGLRRAKRKTEKLIAELQSNSEESCN